MKLAILGAGAIGGFLGARLTRAGVETILIARGSHLEAMRRDGLRMIEATEEYVVHPSVSADWSVMHTVDAVVVTLKAHSMPPLARQLAASLGTDTAVVSAQNGIPWWYFQRHGGELEGLHLETVDPGGVTAAAIDPHRVVGCVVYPAATLEAPGVVRHVEGDRFSLGELDGSSTDRVQALSALLIKAGLKAPLQSNIRQDLWVKLLGNAVFNPLSALTRASLQAIAESPVTAPVVRGAMEEVVEVGRRVGIEIPVSIDRRIRGAARVGGHRTSMLQDLLAGRPLEIDALTGSVVELGDRMNVPVPYLRTLYASVKLLEAARA